MKFENRTGAPITSAQDWERLGTPATAHHWKPGRSAYELAVDWIERDAEARVAEVLAQRPELRDVTLQRGIAEKRTQFDPIARGPRNHDLLIEAALPTGRLIIGVEGKADEAFDRPLIEWRSAREAKSPRSQARKRLDGLTYSFFGTTIEADNGSPPLAALGYQLLSALAGTLADAKVHDAVRAVLLIHEFVTELTDDLEHAGNAASLDAFVERLAGDEIGRSGEPDGWVTAPIPVKGDGVWRPELLPVHVAKLVTRLREGDERMDYEELIEDAFAGPGREACLSLTIRALDAAQELDPQRAAVVPIPSSRRLRVYAGTSASSPLGRTSWS